MHFPYNLQCISTGCFYFILDSDQHFSSLLLKVENIKSYGIDAVLDVIVEDLKKLEEVPTSIYMYMYIYVLFLDLFS